MSAEGHTFEELDFKPRIEPRPRGRYRVRYGVEVSDDLIYSEAAHKLGLAVMHSLTCMGRLDE